MVDVKKSNEVIKKIMNYEEVTLAELRKTEASYVDLYICRKFQRGMTVKDFAKFLNFPYDFVHNRINSLRDRYKLTSKTYEDRDSFLRRSVSHCLRHSIGSNERDRRLAKKIYSYREYNKIVEDKFRS